MKKKRKNILILVLLIMLLLIVLISVTVLLGIEKKMTCKLNYKDEINEVNNKYTITYKFLRVKNIKISNNYKYLYSDYNSFYDNVLNNSYKDELLSNMKEMAINGNKYKKGIRYNLSSGLDYIKLEGEIDYNNIDFKKLIKDNKKIAEIKITKNDKIYKYKKELEKQGYVCK